MQKIVCFGCNILSITSTVRFYKSSTRFAGKSWGHARQPQCFYKSSTRFAGQSWGHARQLQCMPEGLTGETADRLLQGMSQSSLTPDAVSEIVGVHSGQSSAKLTVSVIFVQSALQLALKYCGFCTVSVKQGLKDIFRIIFLIIFNADCRKPTIF